MKKILAIFLVMLVAVVPFAGCGDSAAPETTSSAPAAAAETSGTDAAPAASGETKEVSFWHYMSEDREGKYVLEVVDMFNASQDAVRVNAQYIPRDELMKQYTIGVVSGELPDCGMVDNPDHNSYASMGVFEDLTDRVNAWDEANFLSGPMNSTIYDGKVYGLPWSNNCLGLFYDVDALAAVGIDTPPETWSELEAACEKLTQGTVKGLAISAIGNEEGTFQFMPWLLSAGGDVNNIDSEDSMKSFTYLKGLIDKGYMSKECINWTQGDAEKQFSSGSAAMMINGPWNISSVIESAPDKNWAVAKVPRADDGKFASVLGGENIGICTGGDVDSAWEFFKYLTNAENSAFLCAKMGRFSPRSDVDVQAMFADDPINAVFASLMPDAQPRGPHPRWPEISAAIYTAQQEVFTGQKDVAAATADAQKTIDAING